MVLDNIVEKGPKAFLRVLAMGLKNFDNRTEFREHLVGIDMIAECYIQFLIACGRGFAGGTRAESTELEVTAIEAKSHRHKNCRFGARSRIAGRMKRSGA
jgi:hypothetical protein